MDLTHLYRFGEIEIKSSSKEMSLIVSPLVRNADLKGLQNLWQSINFYDLTTASLIALLRGSSVYKKDLEFWTKAYMILLNKCISLGLDPLKELYGLAREMSCKACMEGYLSLVSEEFTTTELEVYTFKVNTIFLRCDHCGVSITPHTSRIQVSQEIKQLRKGLYYE